METLQAVATTERWISLKGDDGKTRARLNLATGELVIRDRGVYHKWSLRELLKWSGAKQAGDAPPSIGG